MPVTMEYTETLIVCHCWCGIALAIPENLHRIAHESPKDVYCPLGHVFVWGDSFEKKLARERAAHSATKSLLRSEERSHSATKGKMTKLRKRVEAGVCPHCNRSFQNLARHMQSKHAEECKASA